MIKKFFLSICLIFGIFCFHSQQDVINALYFKNSTPSYAKSISDFPKEIIGCYYKNKDSLIELCITKDSIYSSFSIVFNISKKEMNSKKYSIIDSLIYGIKKDTGVPFKKINDTIYAFLKQTDLFFKINAENELKKYEDKYYLSEFIHEKYYTILEISKTEKNLVIKSYDPELDDFPSKFLNLKILNLNNQKIHVADPSAENWKKFIDNNGFNENIIYNQ